MSSSGLLDAVKSRLDIVDVLSEYVQLKRAGQNYKALCPFHGEKTPSFTVSPDKQCWHCFGCGEGGDMVGFVMKHESMTFPEALRFLALKAGVRPEDYEKGEFRKYADEKSKLKPLLKEAASFYREKLSAAPDAQKYLGGRGIDSDAAARFGLGWAPADWGRLAGFFAKKKHPEELVLQTGLCRRGSQGLYDFLRSRVVFPIWDVHGDVIAFGGRVMDASLPKYLNTADSPLFKKGETLYGLNLAKECIRKKGYIVLAEGYLDVMMCHLHGFENVVAPLGTALTEAHLKKIQRYTNRLVLLFDGDSAGVKAAKRGLGLALEQDFRVKVALMPAGEDPDSLLRAKGAPSFKRYLGAALGPVEFVLRATKGPRADVIKEAAGYVARVSDPIMKEELLKDLSELGKIREEALRQEVYRKARPLARPAAGAAARSFPFTHEIHLLSVFVNMPEKRSQILESVELEDIEDPTAKSLLKKLADSAILDDNEKALFARVSIEPGFSPEDADKNISFYLRKIRLKKIERRIKEEAGNPELLGELHKVREQLRGGT